jgi:pimeloyl-ACP methyl ester carboxylesterase
MEIPGSNDLFEVPGLTDESGVTSAPFRVALPERSDRMQPVTFDGCFGWLHDAPGSGASDTGILLCSGLSHDASTAHRPFRLLAGLLADAGYPTLRFDYLGTGDSRDAEAEECLAVWQGSVHAAADWLRETTGVKRIVTVGLRFGAAIAMLAAAAREDMAGLMLLEPVLRGKSYVGQLVMEARLRSHFVAAPDDRLELDELCLTNETVGLMRQLDLRQIKPPPGCTVSIFTQSQSPVLSACLKAWRDTGADVAVEAFTGLEAFLRPAHLADEPCGDFAPILSWLRAAVPPRRLSRQATERVPRSIALRHPGCVEIPVRFGAEDHLFGMVCRPAGNAPCDLAVVIGNTGGHSHHGFARFGVEFARRLASDGIASIRIDFAGLGDSTNPAGDAEDVTHAFDIDRTPDFRAAIDLLEQMGYRRFAVNGLCSGAYHAFHAALADQRISALLSINLPLFTLRFDRPGPSSFARSSMATLSHRRVRSLLLFAGGDTGLNMLERHFGPEGNELADSPDTKISIVAAIDHNLTGRAMRQFAADSMIEFLRQRPLAGGDSGGVDQGASRDPSYPLVS